MNRYFIELSYDGTAYSGWQSQPNARTIQGEIEQALARLLSRKVSITGCGRTDAGVHAQGYIVHADFEENEIDELAYKLNGVLDRDISIHRLEQVHRDAHARFDATSRKYEYFLHYSKNPFKKEYSFFVPLMRQWDKQQLHLASDVIFKQTDFFPFCKSNTDVKTTLCAIQESTWTHIEEEKCWKYQIRANRFLRGMVRLLVGMQLNVAAGKLSIEEVKDAFDKRQRLKRDWSVPANGLFLKEIQYPYFK